MRDSDEYGEKVLYSLSQSLFLRCFFSSISFKRKHLKKLIRKITDTKTNPKRDKILPKDTITVKPVSLQEKSRALPPKEHITDRQRQPRKHCTRKSQDSDEDSLN